MVWVVVSGRITEGEPRKLEGEKDIILFLFLSSFFYSVKSNRECALLMITGLLICFKISHLVEERLERKFCTSPFPSFSFF